MHPLSLALGLTAIVGMGWMNLTLERMRSNINQRLEPSVRIGMFLASYRRGRIVQHHRSLLPKSKLPTQLRIATAVTALGFAGFFIAFFANDTLAK